MGSAHQALTTVLAPGFDQSTTAVLEHPPPPSTVPPNREGAGAIQDVAYVSIGPQAVRVLVGTRTGGIAVIHNVYDPNWHATVDGHPVPVLRTDFLLQGVQVPPGRHVVELHYDDPWVRVGLWTTVAGTLGVVLCILIAGLVQRRSRLGPGRHPPARSLRRRPGT